MNQSQAIEVFRGRQTLLNNMEHIMSAAKKSKKSDLSSQGQLDLFGAGLVVEKKSNIEKYEGSIIPMDFVNLEIDLLGIPVTYNPLDDYWMQKEIYCTNEVVDLLTMSEDKKDIIVMDWITEIEHKISKNDKPYIKIFTSLYGSDYYFYLWGSNYQRLISTVFKGEIYLFQLEYMMPTPEFSRDCVVCTHLKNIKDVDVDSEIERLKNSAKIEIMDRKWIETNKPEWL